MSYKKNNYQKEFSKVSVKFFKKTSSAIGVVLFLIFLFVCFQVYIPVNIQSHETVTYTVQKGWGEDQIASDLQKLGLIRSAYFFRFYVILSLQHAKLQAGDYSLSPRMSAYEIAKKMIQGSVIKNNVIILEGWDKSNIETYLESKNICTKKDFDTFTKIDYSNEFSFLKDKPKSTGPEGYLFPDTYEISKDETCPEIIIKMLANFNKKLTPDLRTEIVKQKKSIFDVVTMASMIEKEVRTSDDKKIVSGILWKRIDIGMPLQIDATINYITGKSDPGASTKDTKINSPYNTYKYRGLPKGPISNPGLNSILAAIYPKKTSYLYYLSDGKTIFSDTLEEHNIAKQKYLGY